MKTNTKKLNFRDVRVDGNTITSNPGDIFTITVGDCVSSEIRFTLRNKYTGEQFYPDALPNKRAAWEWFKEVNEWGRKVEVHDVLEDTTVNFEDSEAYKYRFG